MAVRGLNDYRLTIAGLQKLGARSVTFSIQLRGVSIAQLKPLTPGEREAKLRAALKRQLARLTQEFPDANLKSRNPKEGSWTLDGKLPANKIERLAKRAEVSVLYVSAIDGLSQHKRPPKKKWFGVWGIVAIQVEGQRSGMMEVEDRLVLVRAFDSDDAMHRLEPYWQQCARPYLNTESYLVRWQLVEVKDVFELWDDKLSPKGAEVFSRLRRMKFKPEHQWQPRQGPDRAPIRPKKG